MITESMMVQMCEFTDCPMCPFFVECDAGYATWMTLAELKEKIHLKQQQMEQMLKTISKKENSRDPEW